MVEVALRTIELVVDQSRRPITRDNHTIFHRRRATRVDSGIQYPWSFLAVNTSICKRYHSVVLSLYLKSSLCLLLHVDNHYEIRSGTWHFQ